MTTRAPLPIRTLDHIAARILKAAFAASDLIAGKR